LNSEEYGVRFIFVAPAEHPPLKKEATASLTQGASGPG
jgi:hypothetical protein